MADNSTPLQRANKAALRLEKERMMDMRQGSMAPETSLRPKARRKKDVAPETSLRPKARPVKSFSEGGMIRGCNDSQIGGKKFSGTY